jgi:hypothetical protein
LKIVGFFMFIYGWFMLYDMGLNLEGALCFILGFVIIGWQEILPYLLRKTEHGKRD